MMKGEEEGSEETTAHPSHLLYARETNTIK